jgi:hypothetical protein
MFKGQLTNIPVVNVVLTYNRSGRIILESYLENQ